MATSIWLPGNHYVYVDDDLADWLKQWDWYFCDGYAVRDIRWGEHLYMHKCIYGKYHPLYFGIVDHANGNKADNQYTNLREATKSQDCANRPKQKNNTSGYKGVVWDKSKNRWRARIKHNEVWRHLGYYTDILLAAKAYDAAALLAFGSFAVLNFERL